MYATAIRRTGVGLLACCAFRTVKNHPGVPTNTTTLWLCATVSPARLRSSNATTSPTTKSTIVPAGAKNCGGVNSLSLGNTAAAAVLVHTNGGAVGHGAKGAALPSITSAIAGAATGKAAGMTAPLGTRKRAAKKVPVEALVLRPTKVRASKSAGASNNALIPAGGPQSVVPGALAAGTSAVKGNPKLNKRSLAHKSNAKKKLRVCVLNSSYEGTNSVTAEMDNYHCSPAHRVRKDKGLYSFTEVSLKKDDAYRQVRELVTSNNYDVFFNLCDGGKDEKRAGIGVLEALEEHNAAFTGTDSRSFEPSKIDMKLLVGGAGVNTPNFVLLDSLEGLAKKCRHLRFPVIVKHLSGYASVGINKDSRCDSLDELKLKVNMFLKEFNHALVEEFIRGREGTVLACADSGSPHGVKVFKPLMFNFLQNDDDFAYFEKKWSMECNDEACTFLPHNDPAYAQIMDMARNAFHHIMNGIGYGRVDFRIDPKGDVYFLEINPNCGMWYSEKDGGDFADLMVQGDKSWDHDRFVRNAVLRAVREQTARKPWYFISHDSKGNFSTRASKTVRAGKALFSDAVHTVPVVAQTVYKLGEEDPTVGCVILRGDRLHQAVAIRHSCEPNMHFMQGRTLTLVAKRKINDGEELTVDYATLCDERMPAFACSCGTRNCRSVIFPSPPTPRTLEGKGVRRRLREMKAAWYKEKEDREAERILKKRAARGKNNGGPGQMLLLGSQAAAVNPSPPAAGGGPGPSVGGGSGHSGIEAGAKGPSGRRNPQH